MKPAFVASPRNGSTDLVPRSGSVFDYVSASRLTLWLRCPLAYRLKYIDGIQFRTPPAVFLGKQVHAGLEWYYRHQQFGLDLTSDDVCDFLRRDWGRSVAAEGMRFESTAEEAPLQSKVGELVRVYLAKVAGETARPMAVETAVETPLIDSRIGEDLGIPLVGVLDLVLEGARGSGDCRFQDGGAGRRDAGIESRGSTRLLRLSVPAIDRNNRVGTRNPPAGEDQERPKSRFIGGRPGPKIISAGCSRSSGPTWMTCIHTGLCFGRDRLAAIATSGNGTAASGRDENPECLALHSHTIQDSNRTRACSIDASFWPGS